MNWFEIDKKGLAQVLARKGKEFAIFELIQNSWDEAGVTKVEVELGPDSTAYAKLVVRDNSPNGFQKLSDAYTLFAPSKKKGDPEKRGRFNIGEKLVLALAREARIATTTGTIIFNDNGRRVTKETVAGSEVMVSLRMTKDEMEQAARACGRLLPIPSIKTYINGCPIELPPQVATFEASLITEVTNLDGELIKATRKTHVRVHRADADHPASIYELGIPVCEIEGKYCFNVLQKVPLTMDRQEVLPQFRKQLAVAALNTLHNLMDVDDVNTGMVTEAITSPDAAPEAINDYMDKKFGEHRVSFDPSDPEANQAAAAAGYTVITGSQLGKDAWANVKAAGAISPAGQVFPTRPENFVDSLPAKRTPGIEAVEAYAKKFAREVCGVTINTTFFVSRATTLASYGKRCMNFNVGRLGYAWFNLENNQVKIDDLIIHELGHEYSPNHLSTDYNDALTLIGAKLAQAIREKRM